MSKKPVILTFFKQFPKFAALPLLNFGVDLKFDHISLCVYYQSYIMQSVVFLTYFFQKLSKKNLWGAGSTPPLDTGRSCHEDAIRSCHEDAIFIRKSHTCAGIALFRGTPQVAQSSLNRLYTIKWLFFQDEFTKKLFTVTLISSELCSSEILKTNACCWPLRSHDSFYCFNLCLYFARLKRSTDKASVQWKELIFKIAGVHSSLERSVNANYWWFLTFTRIR